MKKSNYFQKVNIKEEKKPLINQAVFPHYATLKEGHKKFDKASYTELKKPYYLS